MHGNLVRQAESLSQLSAVATIEWKYMYTVSPQFKKEVSTAKNIVYVPQNSPTIDDRIKFAQLMRMLSTPTCQGGAK